MRISRDKDSWNASGIIRRDFRHDKSTPEIPRTRGGKKRKKDLSLCREGKNHIWVYRNYRWSCKTCGIARRNYEKFMKHNSTLSSDQKEQHNKDGIKSHLYIWQKIAEEQLGECNCGTVSYWHYSYCPASLGKFWRNSYNRKAFYGGKKMVEYQHVCISCGHVDKRKTIPAGEEKEWGII